MKNDAIRNIIADVLNPTDDGTGEEPEAPAVEEPVTPEAQGDEGAEEEAVEAEESEAGDGTDIPTDYYGVDLSGLSAEERAAIVAGFQERDKFIQQLLRNKSTEEPKADEPASGGSDAADDNAPLTDDDIKKALGLDDPDDPFAETTAKVAIPLAKLVLDLQEQVVSIAARTEMDATERYWDSSLSALEGQFGKLPLSHDEVMKEAAAAKVAEPVDAYWRIMGPMRQQVMAEVQRRREAVVEPLKKGAKAAVRPKGDAGTAEAIIEAKDVKDATKQALSSLFKERGIRFDED